jgi:hypothetical protein
MSEFDPFARHRQGRSEEAPGSTPEAVSKPLPDPLNPRAIKKAIDHAIKKVIEKHGADRETFLMDILANGPVPMTIIEERGAAHGITKKQLRCAREQMSIITFKETGKLNGCWLWVLPQHIQEAQQATGSSAVSVDG